MDGSHALFTAALRGQLAALDWRVGALVRLVKAWGRAHGIDGAYQGLLSSNALTLMVGAGGAGAGACSASAADAAGAARWRRRPLLQQPCPRCAVMRNTSRRLACTPCAQVLWHLQMRDPPVLPPVKDLFRGQQRPLVHNKPPRMSLLQASDARCVDPASPACLPACLPAWLCLHSCMPAHDVELHRRRHPLLLTADPAPTVQGSGSRLVRLRSTFQNRPNRETLAELLAAFFATWRPLLQAWADGEGRRVGQGAAARGIRPCWRAQGSTQGLHQTSRKPPPPLGACVQGH